MKAVISIVRPLGLSLAALALSTTSQAANLLVNGSFEGYLAAGQSYSAGTYLPGWSVSSGNIDLMCWESQDGACHIDLLGTAHPGTISQSVNTTIGKEYTLSFFWAPNAEWSCTSYSNDGPVKGLNVLLGGSSIATFTENSSGTTPCWRRDWELETVTFTASANSTSIGFSSWNQGGVYGAFLDNVTLRENVSEVPLPGTLGLLGLGIAGLGAIRRDRNPSQRNPPPSRTA